MEVKRTNWRRRTYVIAALFVAIVLWGTFAHLLRVGPYFGRHQATAAAVRGIPLEIILPTPTADHADMIAVLISGDGGWSAIDQHIAAALAEHGIATVGWISPRYFWKRITPHDAARDLARVIDHFTREWGVDRVILIGYSRGADVLPFMVNRLPDSVQAKVAEIALLGPGSTISFQIQPRDYFGGGSASGDFDLLPEASELPQDRLLCVFGEDEPESMCRQLDPDRATVHGFPGGHHFGGDYEGVAELILRNAGAI